jgi:hypothetical protein
MAEPVRHEDHMSVPGRLKHLVGLVSQLPHVHSHKFTENRHEAGDYSTTRNV